MRLILNVENDEKLQVFKALAKALKVKMSVEKKEHKRPSKRLLSAMKEAEKMRVDDEAYPAFSSIEELKKALEA